MTEFEGRLFIDGEFREAQSGKRFEVINPTDELVVGTAADAAAADVALAVGAARRAADGTSWGTDHAFRQRCLRQLEEGLRKESDTARELQVAEAGICVGNLATHVDAMIDDMIAATAAHHGLTVLHDDAGYRTVARHAPDLSEHDIYDIN